MPMVRVRGAARSPVLVIAAIGALFQARLRPPPELRSTTQSRGDPRSDPARPSSHTYSQAPSPLSAAVGFCPLKHAREYRGIRLRSPGLRSTHFSVTRR